MTVVRCETCMPQPVQPTCAILAPEDTHQGHTGSLVSAERACLAGNKPQVQAIGPYTVGSRTLPTQINLSRPSRVPGRKHNIRWLPFHNANISSESERRLSPAMIRAVIVINDQGKPRLVKFYDYQPLEKQQEIIRNIYGVLCRRAENVSNFVQDSTFGLDTRLVYKTFATLYFIVIFDDSENELAILDLMQVFVETLDKCFSNVCELDIVFNFNKVHTILDEIILGGQVVEMSSSEVVKALDDMSRLEKNPNSTVRVPKSISSWPGR
ncbi:hypothetical protein R6Q59_019276 [Mikania micrantha]